MHGMSPSLIRAVIQTESRFNPLAVSRVGAQGLMQLMPTTARHVGIENPFDPRENILGGTKYLSTLLDRFKGNTARALAAYNAGPTVVARHRGLPPYRETQGYVRKIQKLVQNTDAEFSLPVTKGCGRPRCARRASRKAAISHNAARSKSTVRKASTRSVVKKASVRTAKKPVRRAARGADPPPSQPTAFSIASARVRTTFTRAWSLSSASTTVQGAMRGGRAGEHVLDGLLVLRPARAVAPVLRGELVRAERIALARPGSGGAARPCERCIQNFCTTIPNEAWCASNSLISW